MAYADSYSDYPVQRRRGFKIFPLLLFAILGLVYYFGNQETVPITGRNHVVGMSPAQELALGVQSYRQVLMQSSVVRGGTEVQMIRDVGKKLAAVSDAGEDYQWEFNLIDSPEVNAFCLPGGKVAVYSGIIPIAKSQDGLAVVMGHEIAHAIARHGAERTAHSQLAQMGQIALGAAVNDMDENARRTVMGAFGLGAQFGVILPFSRHHESEADEIGLILMARACFKPEEAPSFWERMRDSHQGGQPPEFMSTHPSDERRVEHIRELLPKAMEERAKYCQNGTSF